MGVKQFPTLHQNSACNSQIAIFEKICSLRLHIFRNSLLSQCKNILVYKSANIKLMYDTPSQIGSFPLMAWGWGNLSSQIGSTDELTCSEGPSFRSTEVLAYFFSHYYFFRPLAQSRKLNIVHTKQGVTATASNQSQRCWPRRPHFPLGGGYWQLLKQKGGFSGFASD